MRKQFAKLVEQARVGGDFHERLQLFGDFQVTPTVALDVDFLHVIQQGVTDAMEQVRCTSNGEAGDLTPKRSNKRLRRELAIIVAACIEWEKRIGKD